MSTLPRALPGAPGLTSADAADALRTRQAARAIAALGLLTACFTSSVLSSPEDPFGARLDTRSLRGAWQCVDHRRVPLAAEASGYATVEPGARVTLGTDAGPGSLASDDAHCSPAVSFVPRAGRAYRAEFENLDGRCGLVVYRQVKSNRLGIGVEPSVAPADDCTSP